MHHAQAMNSSAQAQNYRARAGIRGNGFTGAAVGAGGAVLGAAVLGAALSGNAKVVVNNSSPTLYPNVNCLNASGSSNCKNSHNISNCVNCVDCVNCTNCRDLVGCANCTNCSGLTNEVNQRNKHVLRSNQVINTSMPRSVTQQAPVIQQQQYQPALAPTAPPGHSLMSVTCPPNVYGGMNIRVQAPSGLMEVTVPHGIQPGQTFQIAVPSAHVQVATAVPI